MQERCWERLDIEPTADTAIIKKAYAKQLKFNKPDKNPEGFRDLRAAYEQALNESYWYEEDAYEEDDGNDDEYEYGDDTASAVADTPPPLPKSTNAYADAESTEANDIPSAEMIDWRALDTPDADETDSAYQDSEYQNSAYANNDDHDEDNDDGFPLTENEDEAFVLFDNDIWRDEWDQAVRSDDATIDGGDGRLLTLIQSQIDTPRPLDEQNDLEETLLSWFDDQPPLFPRSYDWAKEHFDWNARLKHWSYNHYPWYMIDSLNRRYEQANYFHLPSAFRKFLLLRFPIVARYWSAANLRDDSKDNQTSSNDDDNEVVPIKRLDVFKGLFFPINVGELAYELNTLDQELTYYNQGEMPLHEEVTDTEGKTFNAQYWQKESPLKDLNDWVFKRFIVLEDFGAIALAVVAVLGAASFMANQVFGWSWQNVFQDGMGVFITIALYYLFWQVQVRLFTTPNDLVFDTPLVIGWLNTSVILFIMGYIRWMDFSASGVAAAFTSPVYFLSHIAGASVCLAESLRTRSHNSPLTALLWHLIILLLMIIVVIPLLVIDEMPQKPMLVGIMPISPLVWLLIITPTFLLNISEKYAQLRWLGGISQALFGLWTFILMVGGFMILTYCVNALPKVNLGFTATAIAGVTLIIAWSIIKIIGMMDSLK